jgi:uncharacterized protein YbjQ (UPF0145 family)
MPIMTGLSGNEMYCLQLKGLTPGELVVGNSVHSLGFLGGLGAGLQGVFGGEVTTVTEIINDGRRQSFERMQKEALQHGAHGITSVTSELRRFQGNVEFLSVASAVHEDGAPPPLSGVFSTSGNGQELYCQLDAGYRPLHFVFGNVAYSVGVAGGLFGALKSLGRGEIKEYSDVFNTTRHLALRRITAEARAAGANAVVGIETRIMPFRGVHEMLMLGTASHNPALPASATQEPVTSDLTCEEMWSLANLGYVPLKLVLGTAVYSLGLVGGLKAMFKSFTRGEISDLTSLIYDAREHALGLIKSEAAAIGADDVVGIKTHIHELGNLIEFMAIGTAVKKVSGIATVTPQLPPQAIIKDRDTWISSSDNLFAAVRTGDSGGGGGGGD